MGNLNFRIALTRLELVHARKCIEMCEKVENEKKLLQIYKDNEKHFLEQLKRLLIEKEQILLKLN